MKEDRKLVFLKFFFTSLFINLTHCVQAKEPIEPCAPALSPYEGRLWIYRTAPKGIGLLPRLYVDGRNVGELEPRTGLYADLSPGEHEISVSYSGHNKLIVSIEKAQQIFVRFDLDPAIFGRGFYPVLVDRQVAREQLEQFAGSNPDCKH